MNTSRAGADPEELMIFPRYIQGIKATFALICKGLHQNTLIKQSTISKIMADI